MIEKILDLIFPPSCIWCWSSGSYLCPACKKLLKPHPEICPLTHKNSPWYAVRQDLLTQQNPLDGCIVLFRFEPLIKKLITQLKYYHRAHISTFLGQRLALALESHETLWTSKIHNSSFIITYVPSHWIRHHITKGYNQSELLANAVSQALWIQPPQQLCKKKKNTHSQVGMSREERKKNLSDAFRVSNPIPEWSIIFLVDDVLTSGATMVELAKTIKHHQPNCAVWGMCVARNW